MMIMIMMLLPMIIMHNCADGIITQPEIMKQDVVLDLIEHLLVSEFGFNNAFTQTTASL